MTSLRSHTSKGQPQLKAQSFLCSRYFFFIQSQTFVRDLNEGVEGQRGHQSKVS